jgi:hypothetical protein
MRKQLRDVLKPGMLSWVDNGAEVDVYIEEMDLLLEVIGVYLGEDDIITVVTEDGLADYKRLPVSERAHLTRTAIAHLHGATAKTPKQLQESYGPTLI